ncbi:hypothetical protein Ddye_021920 [Dipteronia dyeriana]|uniref:Uncharacterized protein n=1 Tax=Dipteronia dyeriana TaxID=168575 RepID=A0AAD9WYG0_9ROSI|nr:hypothetical protein Ddye_021920 [Dipteronia dyeriana]
MEPASGFGEKELYLHQKSVSNLLELEGGYDAVIVCVGAKADTLPELSRKLPLRTCHGIVACMELLDNIRGVAVYLLAQHGNGNQEIRNPMYQ